MVENVTEDWWYDIDEKRTKRQKFQRWIIAGRDDVEEDIFLGLEDVVGITGLPRSGL